MAERIEGMNSVDFERNAAIARFPIGTVVALKSGGWSGPMKTQRELEQEYRRFGKLNPYLGKLHQYGRLSLEDAEALQATDRNYGMPQYIAHLAARPR